MNRKIIVGNGWAALATLAFELTSSESELIWVLGSGTRVPPILPTLPEGHTIEVLRELMKLCGVDVQPADETPSADQFVSEYKNKSLRPPSWEKLSDELWGAEHYLISSDETECGISMERADQILRQKVDMQVGARIRKIEECAVREMHVTSTHVSLILASGETLEADECIYADRWSDLKGIKGAPKRAKTVGSEEDVKLADLLRHSDPTGVIQVTFKHKAAIDVQEQHGIFALTHRESGENFDRRVWGYFMDAKTSRWTLALTHEEAEDNHLIAKKIRRIKQTLNRIAADLRWCPEGMKEFSDTIESEHVRLEEGVLFSAGDAIHVPLHSGKHLKLIGDSFGVAAALEQVAGLYISPPHTETAERVDASS